MPTDREMKNITYGSISSFLMETNTRIGMLLSPNVYLKLIVDTLRQIYMRNLVVSFAFTSPEVVVLKVSIADTIIVFQPFRKVNRLISQKIYLVEVDTKNIERT